MMPEDDFYNPTDIDKLRMENELLSFEIRYLRAELADPERKLKEMTNEVAELRRKLTNANETRDNLAMQKQRLQRRIINQDEEIEKLKDIINQDEEIGKLRGRKAGSPGLLSRIESSWPFSRFVRDSNYGQRHDEK